MTILFLSFLFIFGLHIGSFLNVLIDRLPKGRSILGRSNCDYCRKIINWYDLVPVVSYFILKGKCRFCRKSLTGYYPIVEVLTAVLFVLSWIFLPVPSIGGKIVFLAIMSVLVTIFFADMKYRIIPDSLQLALLVFGIGYLSLTGSKLSLGDHLLGSFLVLAPILGIFLITKGKGMGFGDVKLAGIIGLLFGIKVGAVAVYIAFVIGAIFGIILIILKRKRLKSKIAFGPFLVTGMIVSFFFQEALNNLVFRLYGF